ncbi:hypothetical protein F4803DRAFT_502128 [Xylaria telfairii]|nr:hypothetical protein F4803DRAFT_502128 [Xylaria telfairii]
MIRDLDSGKAIAMVQGLLTMILDVGTRGGWQWKCEEVREGWTGFCNVVSGKYLGRDNKGGFCAQASKLKDRESFVLCPQQAGGYNLFVNNWSSLTPISIFGRDIRLPSLIEDQSPDAAARWEFVKVQYDLLSQFIFLKNTPPKPTAFNQCAN